jgi:hypothetical protein
MWHSQEPHKKITSREGGKRQDHEPYQMQTERAPARGIKGTQQEIMIIEVDLRFVYSNQRGRARPLLAEVRDSRLPPSQPVNSGEIRDLAACPFQLVRFW